MASALITMNVTPLALEAMNDTLPDGVREYSCELLVATYIMPFRGSHTMNLGWYMAHVTVETFPVAKEMFRMRLTATRSD